MYNIFLFISVLLPTWILNNIRILVYLKLRYREQIVRLSEHSRFKYSADIERLALAALDLTPKAASPIVSKLVKSAQANAVNNFSMDGDNLYVAECFVTPQR